QLAIVENRHQIEARPGTNTQLQIRMALFDSSSQLRKQLGTGCEDGADAHMPALPTAHRTDFIEGILEAGLDSPCMTDHRLAIERRHHATGMSLEQRYFQAILEFLEQLGDGRLGDPQTFGGTI